MKMSKLELDSVKNIYDYALLIEKKSEEDGMVCRITDEGLLLNSLIRIVENEESSYAIKILGENQYLECLKYYTGFRKEDINESYKVFDEIYPKYKNENKNKKIKFLEAMIAGKNQDLKKKFSYFICKMNNFSSENIGIVRNYNLKLQRDYRRKF